MDSSPRSYLFTSATVRISVHTALKVDTEQNLFNMWRSTVEISAAQLRSVTEITPKSPFLCENRSPIRYCFFAGAKAIRHSVNIALLLLNNKRCILTMSLRNLELVFNLQILLASVTREATASQRNIAADGRASIPLSVSSCSRNQRRTTGKSYSHSWAVTIWTR